MACLILLFCKANAKIQLNSLSVSIESWNLEAGAFSAFDSPSRWMSMNISGSFFKENT